MAFVSDTISVLMSKGLTRKQAKEVFNSTAPSFPRSKPQWVVSRQYDRWCLRKGPAARPTYRFPTRGALLRHFSKY